MGISNAARLVLLLLAAVAPLSAQDAPLALRVERMLDGRGGVQTDVIIRVEEGRIVGVGSSVSTEGASVVDLRGTTVLPGLIDTHVHIAGYFDPATGRSGAESDHPEEERILFAAENAYRNLMAGFTTVQSMGAEIDKPLRDAIARGVIPGARILTSLRWITGGTPEELRVKVRQAKADGADFVKLFASGSLRIGGPTTMSLEQLTAACDEAGRLGMRSAVHAHGDESAQFASEAGCTVIEHGALVGRETLEVLARNGTYFDPNIYLVSVNYLSNRDRFIGIGNYTEEGFRLTEESIPVKLAMFETALTVPDLKIAFGTDAVAGAHGRQTIELKYRVEEAGQTPMDAILSATSVAAESMDMGDRIGSIAPGLEADLIAVRGNPDRDINALDDVVFVMKGGQIYKNHMFVTGR